ncbi:MAG: hypothetical protein QGD91_11730 [Actinomycetota bacterium]|nr:hypothetical protein [Actinomycetota bacterium]
MGDVTRIPDHRFEKRLTVITGRISGELLAGEEPSDGNVVLAPSFAQYDHLMQKDLLEDWIGLLQRYLDDITEMEDED